MEGNICSDIITWGAISALGESPKGTTRYFGKSNLLQLKFKQIRLGCTLLDEQKVAWDENTSLYCLTKH